jgi:hypothetical protein
MGVEDMENKKTAKKRLSLGDMKAARASLCKLMRLYNNNGIDPAPFRNQVYSFNTLLAYDKQIQETELNKRIEALEQLVKGEGNTLVDSDEIDNPYAESLRKQLAEAHRKIGELTATVMQLKGRNGQEEA